MAEFLSKVKIGTEVYELKDATARADVAKKQDIIDADHKLPAVNVSFEKGADSKLTSTDVNAAIGELEKAIETGGTGSVVTVEKAETAEEGYFATYTVKQGGAKVGVSINIPKDYLVKSGEIKTVEAADAPYKGAKKGDKYIDFVINAKEGVGTESHLYLPVNELVDAYKADESSLTLGEGNVFSIKAVAMDKVTGLNDKLSAVDTTLGKLKALAYKDEATGIVAGQTIASVAVSGDINLDTTGAFSTASANATLTKADYTPAGSVTASISKDADKGVAVSGSVSAPVITVNPSTDSIAPVTSVGSMASVDVTKFNAGALPTLSAGSYTKPSLGAASSSNFVTSGMVAAIDESDSEMLVLSAAPTGKALTAQGAFDAGDVTFGSLSGGELPSLGAGFFTAGAAPTLGAAKSFVTSVTAESAAPVFTGDKFAVNASFAGTAVEGALVTGVAYDKTSVDASLISASLENAKTGAIEVAAKEVTVK